MYKPSARLIIESENGIDMVTGISKARGEFLKFRQVIAGKTILNGDVLPIYTISMKKLEKVDNIRDKAVYYVKKENIMRIAK
jgi:hypothetical protein